MFEWKIIKATSARKGINMQYRKWRGNADFSKRNPQKIMHLSERDKEDVIFFSLNMTHYYFSGSSFEKSERKKIWTLCEARESCFVVKILNEWKKMKSAITNPVYIFTVWGICSKVKIEINQQWMSIWLFFVSSRPRVFCYCLSLVFDFNFGADSSYDKNINGIDDKNWQ